MTNRELVIKITEETSMVQRQVQKVVQRTLDHISNELAKGTTVELRNFGVFEVKMRKAHVGRNPKRPETAMPIPRRAAVKFKPGKEMREAVLKLPTK